MKGYRDDFSPPRPSLCRRYAQRPPTRRTIRQTPAHDGSRVGRGGSRSRSKQARSRSACGGVKIASTMDMAPDCVHFSQGNLTNALIGLNNSDTPGDGGLAAGACRKQRIEMRLLFALAAACALCQTAMAQTPECKSISDSAARLACYDRTKPPKALPAAARPGTRAAPAPASDNAKYVDPISAEDALMDQRIKGICRGC
jgi:hypothetical protein